MELSVGLGVDVERGSAVIDNAVAGVIPVLEVVICRPPTGNDLTLGSESVRNRVEGAAIVRPLEETGKSNEAATHAAE